MEFSKLVTIFGVAHVVLNSPTLMRNDLIATDRVWRSIFDFIEHSSGNEPCSIINFIDSQENIFSTNESISKNLVLSVGMSVFSVNMADANETLSIQINKAKRLRQVYGCVQFILLSNSIEVLDKFAQESKIQNLLTRHNRLLVVGKLERDVLYNTFKGYWTLTMMRTAFLTLDDDYSRAVVFEFKPFGENCQVDILIRGSWTVDSGLSLFEDIYQDKFNNFRSCEVNITALPFPPYWDEKIDPATSNIKYTGSDALMMEAISNNLNFNIRVLKCKNWDEVSNLVQRKISMVAPVMHILYYYRTLTVGYSHVYLSSKLSVTRSNLKIKNSWKGLYYIFSSGTWIAVIMSLVVVPIIFFLILQNIKNLKYDMLLCFQEYLKILLQQPISKKLAKRDADFIRVFLLVCLIFAFLLTSSYKSNLIAHLTLPTVTNRIETLHQLAISDSRLTSPQYNDDDILLKTLKSSHSEDIRNIAKKTIFVKTAMEGLKMALANGTSHINDNSFIKHQIASTFERGLFYQTREHVMVAGAAWLLPKSAPYAPQFDNIILRVLEAGLYEMWIEEVLEDTRRNQKSKIGLDNNTEEDESLLKSLNLLHLQWPFYILVIGYVLSSLVLFLETFATCK